MTTSTPPEGLVTAGAISLLGTSRRRRSPNRRQASMPADGGGSSCAHHWLIETPSGETSPARCKRCGAERQFKNGLQHKGLYNSAHRGRSVDD